MWMGGCWRYKDLCKELNIKTIALEHYAKLYSAGCVRAHAQL